MTSNSDSISKGWRDKGTISYKNYQQSNDDGRRKSFLESALKSYYRAYETADNADDKSSAAKNYGMASWRLATVMHDLGEKEVLTEHKFQEAIRYFSKAVSEGKKSKPSKWMNDLADSYGACVLSALEFIQGYQSRAGITALENYLNAMCEETQKAACFLEMASVTCKAGIAALGDKNFVHALQAFHDCYRPVQECFRLSSGKEDMMEMFKEAEVIQNDVNFHMATAEALQAIKIGDDTLKAALENDEQMNMSLVYDSLDLYKRAVVATREVETEMEAMAVSRLGSLFDKVLKMKSKAKQYFNLCMQLSASLQPRNLATEEWYKTCTEALQRYQKEQSEAPNNDEAVRQAEREQLLKELETELEDIKNADVGSGAAGLLRHIYKTYPPKNPDHKLDEVGVDDSKKMKKILLTAVQHYHPDKQDKETHGKKWAVFCDEITKLLNRRYEAYKFPDESTS